MSSLYPDADFIVPFLWSSEIPWRLSSDQPRCCVHQYGPHCFEYHMLHWVNVWAIVTNGREIMTQMNQSGNWKLPHCVQIYTLWCHDMKTFSALLALCEGNPPVTSGFSSQSVSNMELWCLLWFASEQMVEQTVELPVISHHDSHVTSL